MTHPNDGQAELKCADWLESYAHDLMEDGDFDQEADRLRDAALAIRTLVASISPSVDAEVRQTLPAGEAGDLIKQASELAELKDLGPYSMDVRTHIRRAASALAACLEDEFFYNPRTGHVAGEAGDHFKPFAWVVISEPNEACSFHQKREEAEHAAHNYLIYVYGCKRARIEPLYLHPAENVWQEGFSEGYNSDAYQQGCEDGSRSGEALAWAVERWNAEVKNRPLVNVHRRSLDDTWRQVMRHFGGDPDALVGPSHDELLEKDGADKHVPAGDATHLTLDEQKTLDVALRASGDVRQTIPAGDDHARGCQGREYTCTCGYDARLETKVAALIAERDEAVRESDKVCDSYVAENQRLFDKVEAAEAKVAALDEIISECAKACGVFVSAEASIEFKRMLPGEIEAKVAALRTALEKARWYVDVYDIRAYNRRQE